MKPFRVIETDGIGASLMAVACATCGKNLGAKVCEPHQAGLTSHGICPSCSAAALAELTADEGSNLSETAAVPPVSTPPGSEQAAQDTGATTPARASGAPQNGLVQCEHASGGDPGRGPAVTLNPDQECEIRMMAICRPDPEFVAFIEQLLGELTGGRN